MLTVNQTYPTLKVFDRQYSFFDDLATMLFSLACSFLTMERLRRAREPHSASVGLSHILAKLEETDDLNRVIELYSESRPDISVFYAHDIIDPVLRGTQPDRIAMRFGQATPVTDLQFQQTKRQISDAPNLKLAAKMVSRVSFVSYYESQKDAIESRYGSTTDKWPMVLNFARVIRNAFAHGGVHFKKKTMTAVTWRGLTFSPADEGKDVLYGPNGLSTTDIILLMQDMHDAIYT